MILSLWVEITINKDRFDLTKYCFENALKSLIQIRQNHISLDGWNQTAED
jgi:hypothetical protein